MKRERGDISLAAGEPDFGTRHVRDAAIRAMDSRTRYTNVDGIPAQRRSPQNSPGQRDRCRSDEYFVASGGKQIIFNALMATLNPGDEVMSPSPTGSAIPRSCGCATRPDLRRRRRLHRLQAPRGARGGDHAEPVADQHALEPDRRGLHRRRSLVSRTCCCAIRTSTSSPTTSEVLVMTAAPSRRSRRRAAPAGANADDERRLKSRAMTGWRIGYCATETLPAR